MKLSHEISTLKGEMLVLSAKDVTVNTEWLKVMCVGESGTGKSIFASTFPTPGFLFDFGKEVISYRGKDFDYEQYDLTAKGWANFEKTYTEVKKKVDEKKYCTVVIDNLSAMTDTCMEKAMQLDPKRSATGGPLWQVHYAMVKNLMEGRLRQMLNLNCNLVFIAHLDTIKDEEGAVIGVEPAMTGKLSADVPAYFDEVYYCTVRREGGDTKWFVQTVPIGRNHGRSRLSGMERLLPDLVENNYNEIIAYLSGKKKKKPTGLQPTTTK
jgi:hypothetical protein